MQRTALILAYLLICVNCFSQQYPFVHYTPRDGLISNMIKSVYQDSKGRLYFTSLHGLSVYDGSRFINYTSKNGLNYDIVNCIMEMGDDSIWIITNSSKINCLVNGKIKLLPYYEHGYVINNLCRDSDGEIYAAAEEGLLVFNKKDRFLKLPFINAKGVEVSSYISSIFSAGDHLLLQRDNSMLPVQDEILYLYNKKSKKITAELPGVLAAHMAKDGRIWISTENEILSIDTNELYKGSLITQQLPQKFSALRKLGKYFVHFDDGNNCWLGDQNNILIKASPEGTITTFTSASGLNMFFINSVFRDREGITWIATNNTGVSKLVHTNFSQIEKPFDITNPSDISYNKVSGNLLIYSRPANLAAVIHNDATRYLHIENQLPLLRLIETPNGFFGVNRNTVYKLDQKDHKLYPRALLSDSSDNVYPDFIVDNAGNLIIPGKYHLSAIINGHIIFKTKVPFFGDVPAVDSKGNIWLATRANDLLMYQTHPEEPSHYLEQKHCFKKELEGFSPRSIVIDQQDNIWIGSRSHGIHVFSLTQGKLIKRFSITTGSGLSDDFTTHLMCDAENAIWATSALGLDKITIKNGTPVIENITRQNNIYQSVFNIVNDNDNNLWCLVSNGMIRITPENRPSNNYSPTLMISMLRTEKDTILNSGPLKHNQNNLDFHFAATSFLNEKQIQYSYRLEGVMNSQWSEPSNNANVSFIDLRPGDYDLEIKAKFPSGRYPEEIISYKFSIAPAWWQTWWFKLGVALLLVGLLIIGSRSYYRRKLEKQQAIEKERTRIATDMHDDLGAGLSRIKFLSQSMNKKLTDENLRPELEKITLFSDEMSEKMGEIIWALNEKNDTIADLIAYTRSYVVEYLSNHNIHCDAVTPSALPENFIPGEMRRNIFLSVKECLHNVVKHSAATKVLFTVELNETMKIIIHDNGKGIDWNNQRAFSNGLQNINKRMNDIKGEVVYSNEAGTKVSLTVPISL